MKLTLNRSQLKWIAILAMTIDHIALAFLDSGTSLYFGMRLIGRITAPMMSFFLAEGFRHTRNFRNYLSRMLLFALIAQPFYFFLVNGRYAEHIWENLLCLNVMFTLSISLVMLRIVSRKDLSIHKRIFLLLPCFMIADMCDWSYCIPVWVLLFYYMKEPYWKRDLLYILVSAVMMTIRILSLHGLEPEYLYCYGVLLAVIPMHLYNSNVQQKSRKQLEKWAFYIYLNFHPNLTLIRKKSR